MPCKVLLIDPYIDYPSKYNFCSFNNGLLAIASHCLNKKMDVDFRYYSEMLVLQYPHLKNLKSVLENFEPDLVLISVITSGWYSANEIAKTIKLYKPSIIIVIGGVFPTLVGDIIFNKYKYFDIVVKGEGELVVEHLISEFLKKGTFTKGVFSTMQKVDIPKLNLIPIANYSKIFGHFPFIIEMGRGCPFECSFCYLRDFNKPLRFKPIKILSSEISILNERGIKSLFFSDDNLNLNSFHFRETIKILTSYDFEIILETRLDHLYQNKSMSKNLKNAGVSEIIYGVENIDLEILSSMKKGTEKYGGQWRTFASEVTKLLDNNGIISHPIFMLGWPGETNKMLEKLTQFACDLGKLYNVEPFVSFATPHPGSSFRRSFLTEFSSIATDLRRYIHILPVATPKSLGINALSLLINAHNRIRIESNMIHRNPTISLEETMNYWNHVDYTTLPFFGE